MNVELCLSLVLSFPVLSVSLCSFLFLSASRVFLPEALSLPSLQHGSAGNEFTPIWFGFGFGSLYFSFFFFLKDIFAGYRILISHVFVVVHSQTLPPLSSGLHSF